MAIDAKGLESAQLPNRMGHTAYIQSHTGISETPPCAGLTSGTLTAAQYQQSDAYNIDGGITTGPDGSYIYGSSHPTCCYLYRQWLQRSPGCSREYDVPLFDQRDDL